MKKRLMKRNRILMTALLIISVALLAAACIQAPIEQGSVINRLGTTHPGTTPITPEADQSTDQVQEKGEDLLIIGNPLVYSRVPLEGVVEGYRAGSGGEILEFSAPIHPGHSGSPVFSNEGKVVAVVYASLTFDGSEQRGLAVPVSYLWELIDSLDSDYPGLADTPDTS